MLPVIHAREQQQNQRHQDLLDSLALFGRIICRVTALCSPATSAPDRYRTLARHYSHSTIGSTPSALMDWYNGRTNIYGYLILTSTDKKISAVLLLLVSYVHRPDAILFPKPETPSKTFPSTRLGHVLIQPSSLL